MLEALNLSDQSMSPASPTYTVTPSVEDMHATHLPVFQYTCCSTRLTLPFSTQKHLKTLLCRPCCWPYTCGLPCHSLSYRTSSFCHLAPDPHLQVTSPTLTHPRTWLALQLRHSLQRSIYRSCCLFCGPPAAVIHAYTVCGSPFLLCYCPASPLSR